MDKSNSARAMELLVGMKAAIENMKNDEISLKYHILKAKCLRCLEDWDSAVTLLGEMYDANNESYELLIALAEINLAVGDLESNLKYLEAAQKVNSERIEGTFQLLLRKMRTGVEVDITELEKINAPEEGPLAASLFRLYGIAWMLQSDHVSARKWFKRSIDTNPNRFDTKRRLLELDGYEIGDLDSPPHEKREAVENLYHRVEGLIDEHGGYHSLDLKDRVQVSLLKLNLALCCADRRKGSESEISPENI